MKILGIIPARGGSKGIPNKNIIDLNGKPLIYYSINIGNKLIEMGALSRCILSTDSQEIAITAKSLGGEVPFLRPIEIAQDNSKSIEYVMHALRMVGGNYDAIMILQPTCPIRNLNNIVNAVREFTAGNFNSMISCYEEEYLNDLVQYYKKTDGSLIPKSIEHNKNIMRQEHGSTYIRNGSIYLTKSDHIYK
jgi:CMP-N-acetylneuraminic acid synthetase